MIVVSLEVDNYRVMMSFYVSLARYNVAAELDVPRLFIQFNQNDLLKKINHANISFSIFRSSEQV